ncbi:MAG: MFS transporter [Caldimonas sp.]|nr:MAG: MFS transporter [Caldimonas sp.]
MNAPRAATSSQTASLSDGGAYPWYVVCVLMLAAVVSLIDRLLVGLLVEPIRRDLGISDFQISLLQGLAFSLFFCLAGLPLGRLVDRTHRRNLVAAGITFWSLMTAAAGLAQHYWQLFLTRAGVGVGEATLGPAAYSIISDYFERHRLPLALSVFTLGTALGSGAAFAIGGLVGGWAQRGDVVLPLLGTVKGWQLAFMLVGLPGLLVAALMFTVREPPRRHTVAGGQVLPVSAVVRFLRERRRLALGYVVGISLAFCVTYALLAWMATFYIRVHGLPVERIGPLLGALILSLSPLGIVTGGWWAGLQLRRGQRDATLRTAAWSLAAATPFLVATPLLPSATASLLAFGPGLFLSSMFISLGTSTIQLVTPNEMRGQISALGLMLTTVLGSVLGPSLVAACTDFVFADERRIGHALALTFALALPVCVTALVLSLRPLREAALVAESWDHPTSAS